MSNAWLVWRGEWDGRHLFGIYYSAEIAEAWAEYARKTGEFESERRSVKIEIREIVATVPPPVPKESMSGLLDRVTVDKPLMGIIFALAGTLPNRSRDETKQIIEAAGGVVHDNVTVETDCLVAGESPGSKFDKAKLIGVPVLDETELEGLLGINA